MNKNKIDILGAGGHAKVVIEIAELSHLEINKIYDCNSALQNILDYEVSDNLEEMALSESLFFALGNNKARRDNAILYPRHFINLIHPAATLSKRVKIGAGNVIMAGAVINSSVSIGDHCIVNTCASIDHDCNIGDYVHISPRVALAGNVHIGEGSHIGIGATVNQQVVIGKWCTIGAGSVVINNVEDYGVVVGNPGKMIKFNDE